MLTKDRGLPFPGILATQVQMTAPELLALARKHHACAPALKAAAGYTDLGSYCRDYPGYAEWMIATKEFWDSLTAEQRQQVCEAAPGLAIATKEFWDSLTAEQRWQLCLAAPGYAIAYRHAWDSLTIDQRWQVCEAAPGYAIAYRRAWDSLTWFQKIRVKIKYYLTT